MPRPYRIKHLRPPVGRQNLDANEFRPWQSQIEIDSENLFAGQLRYEQGLVSREVGPAVSDSGVDR
jgi:hypothetical protein